MTDLSSLIERVEKATGKDRELDLAILKGVGNAPHDAQWEKVDDLGGKKLPVSLFPKRGWETPEYRKKTDAWFTSLEAVIATHPSEDQYREWKTTNPEPEWDWRHAAPAGRVPPLTDSLDAALALVEEKLPGWTWEIGISPAADHLGEADKFVAHLRTPRGVLIGGAHGFMESGLSAPLALILALLRALSNGSKEGENV